MPRCYPPDPDWPPDRHGERAVFEALRDQLPEECAVFSSVGLTERGKEREIDILVGWPGHGIAVIEVKGGTVSCVQRQWWQSSGANRHKIQSPITQAQDAKHMLLRFLSRSSTVLPKVRAAHLVAFPYTSIGKDWQTPDCPRDMAIGRGELKAAATTVLRAIDNEGKGFQPLDLQGCVALETALEGMLPGQASLLSVAEEHEHRVDQMTRDQLKLLNMLRHHRRAAVIGGAGTGKTWLAAEQAHRLAAAGERVALLCYSRGLARFLQRLADTWPVPERPAFTGLFHDLPIEWGAPTGENDDSDYWERRLPQALGELAIARSLADRFDSIIVDEAQDFGELWWPPLLSCLRDPDEGGLFVFLDEAQRVFARQGQLPIRLAPFELDENIRNTKNVAQTFASLSDEQLRFRGLAGPPVRFVQCATDEALPTADDQVEILLDDWEPGQIALLTTGRRHGEQVNEIELGGHKRYWDTFFDEREVFYGHVLGFKGLERPVVVLAVNGFRDLERAKEMLYVGLSRARTQLVVCGDLALIAKVGGEGVRKRLQRAEQG
jgi:Nuclease-related domain/UvrD-like helicase C-terminal domain/PhoH-like protein